MNTPKRADSDSLTGPIRTYAQVVRAMRTQGDEKITVSMIHFYEKSALRKLARLLDEYREGL